MSTVYWTGPVGSRNLKRSTIYYFGIKTGDEVPTWSALVTVVSATTDAEQDAMSAPDDLLAVNSTDGCVTLT